MTDFQILAAIRKNGGYIGYTDLINQGLSDPNPDPVADKHRILNLLSENYISGNTEAYGAIHMEPRGTALLDQFEQKINQIEENEANLKSNEKRQRRFTVAITVLSSLLSFIFRYISKLIFG